MDESKRRHAVPHLPEPERPKPVPIILNCPVCHARHYDDGVWATKPHHTHSCQVCGVSFRPAVVDTVGVRFLPGFKNGPQHGDKMKLVRAVRAMGRHGSEVVSRNFMPGEEIKVHEAPVEGRIVFGYGHGDLVIYKFEIDDLL